jgi:hypothetical protein
MGDRCHYHIRRWGSKWSYQSPGSRRWRKVPSPSVFSGKANVDIWHWRIRQQQHINLRRYLCYGSIPFYLIYPSCYWRRFPGFWRRWCGVTRLDIGVWWSLVPGCILLVDMLLNNMQVRLSGIGMDSSGIVNGRWLYMILSRYMYVNELTRILPWCGHIISMGMEVIVIIVVSTEHVHCIWGE